MPRLVLIGSGLAHLHVLHAWRRVALPGVELVVVAPHDHYYSGMVPAFLRGARDAADMRIDVAMLARCAGARHVDAIAERLSSSTRIIDTTDGPLEFDLCSIDVGGGVAGSRIPGVTTHTFPLRPMTRALALRDALDARCASHQPFHVVVVGAGAGGVEVALAVQQRIAATGGRGMVRLVDAAPMLLAAEPPGLRISLAALLHARGIGLVLGDMVARVTGDAVHLASGASLPADLVVWLPGVEPPPLLAASDLRTNDAGYLLVDRTLAMSGSGKGIWGAGDCIALADGPALPRSGAYAVRQGPVLLANLRAALGRGRVRRYTPRARSLVLLDTADGRAMARWGTLHGGGTLAWRLKRRIDRRYVEQFRVNCDERGAPGS